MNVRLIARLSVMMFVQYFIWGAWAPTLGNYMTTIGAGEWIPLAYALGPVACMIGPFFLGMVADRFFDSEKLLGVLMLIAGAAMCAMPFAAGTDLFLPLLGLHALCYFPTLGLTASLAFHHLKNQEKEFPWVRVFGTIGWATIGLFMGYVLQADNTATPLYIGGGAALFLGLYSFTLPYTPPPSKGQTTTWKQIAGIDAFNALKSKSFVVFLAAAMLIFIAFGTYFPYAPIYFSAIHENFFAGTGFFANPSGEMAWGQVSEIFFMLLIPFFFRRLGVKWMLLLGMLAWVARFAIFAVGASVGTYYFIMIGILIHGICYDFFFVTGQIYIDKKTAPEIRGQVQGLLVLLTQGIGFFLGTQLSGLFVNTYGVGGQLDLGGWATFWYIFAAATFVFSVAFVMLFNDRVADNTEPAKT
ncbi:MAG: MFS transporter [Bacteroidetes bacterium]|nr:MFS transporter [Bacteroidota bacterium]MYD19883.1 nucleoside permease [Rhodothermaceae bacterium]MDE2672820.1 MFS transporter [Bacteroidota bacterium]MYD55416.1 nucleoside permease [Rhodothermaceae bacterium]MYF39293.1 nucleoside permease [Rhodothermaceae bacterium]